MAYNKVVMNTPNGEETLIDLTSDTVTSETLVKGVTAHNAAGEPVVGELEPSSVFDADIIEFSQMNDLVTAYLADADATYTDSNGSSVSVITKYATATGDKDRPLGLNITTQSGTRYLQNETTGNGSKFPNLIGSISTIFNAVPNEISQYLVKDSNGNILDNGRIKPTGKVRMIKFYGYPHNCRDLGGWNCDGGTVKYGKLFRSSAVGAVDNTAVAIVKGLGIHHEIDLREADELTAYSFASIVNYHHEPLALYFDNVIDPTQGDYASIINILKIVFNAVTHDEAVLYHCAIGRDRTGTVSALLLSLLGVATKDIDKDFELSSFSALNTPANRTSSDYRSLITAITSYGKSTLMAGAVTWCLKAGFTIDEINAFRSAMVNGTPTVLKEEDYVTTYTITQTLSNCTSNISQTSIAEDAPLSVVITPNNDYELSSLTVTMGGTNITSTVVSGDTITIPKVTGNIVITATATEIIRYTNLLPLSTKADGTLFVEGVGYKTGYNLNAGTGEETSRSGYEVSGFIPYKATDTFRIKDCKFNAEAYDNICFYDSNFGFVGAFTNKSSYNPLNQFGDSNTGTMVGCISTATTTNFNATKKNSIAYMRLSAAGIKSSTIVTVNEEIV